MDKRLKTALMIGYDCLATVAAWVFAAIFRNGIVAVMMETWFLLIVGVGVTVVCHIALRLYSDIWKYAGIYTAIKLLISAIVYLVFNTTVAIISETLDIEWAILASGGLFVFITLSRFARRMLSSVEALNGNKKTSKTRVIIVGAGAGADNLIKELKTSDKINMNPVCILDDDKNKLGKEIFGVKVVGSTQNVVEIAEKYRAEEIIIAIPSANKKQIAKIANECNKTKCKVKTVPGLYQLANGNISVTDFKSVSIDDLLGREQVKVNLDQIMGYIEGKTVLVTGGGGSIGSELCRQIAWHNPKELIILDIYENNAYDIQQEIIRHLPNVKLIVLIASVRDKVKIDDVFSKYKPQVVFHAAAHKHVPLMETSPNEAVKNNVGGTFNVADAAGRYGVEKFVLISTDKAVNPTNVMGATKRICEMIVQAMNERYKTDYVAVRFGNVLGSNGSVIPLFKRQIREGGPITVTHKDIVRYFMTIPEAVSLVLQAGAYAKGGEIFVLDMGEQVRIYDLAINLIKLSGLEPFKDIDIKVTGLRPGEKLYEERLMEEEGLQKTLNEKISIGKPLDIDKELFEKLTKLIESAYTETDDMKDKVHEIVPTYVIDRKN